MKFRLTATVAASALLLGLAAPAFAAPAAALAPAPVTAQAQQGVVVPPLGFTKRVLPNGLEVYTCLLYTSPSPRDRQKSRMPSSA